MKRFIFNLVFFIGLGLLSACDNEIELAKSISELPAKKEVLIINNLKTLSVSDGFTLVGKAAVSIYLGVDDSHYIDITLQKKNIKEGYSFDSVRRSVTTQDTDAQYNGYFIESSKEETYSRFKLLELNTKDKLARVFVDAKLFNFEEQNFIHFKCENCLISGDFFAPLDRQ